MHDLVSLPLGRRRSIAERLLRGEPVVASLLAIEFDVSEDAIRRDLRALAKDGMCRRVYGGALPLSPVSAPIERRTSEDIPRKLALAQAALKLISEGQTLFLDLGSTNLQLAKVLPGGLGLKIVTNSIHTAASLATRDDISLFFIGGEVRSGLGGCVDARSIAEMLRFRLDLSFLGACAMSAKHGIAGFDLADVDFKSALVEASGQTALMLTNPKIETGAPFHIASANSLDHLVVEQDAPSFFVDTIRGAGLNVIMANKPVI